PARLPRGRRGRAHGAQRQCAARRPDGEARRRRRAGADRRLHAACRPEDVAPGARRRTGIRTRHAVLAAAHLGHPRAARDRLRHPSGRGGPEITTGSGTERLLPGEAAFFDTVTGVSVSSSAAWLAVARDTRDAPAIP